MSVVNAENPTLLDLTKRQDPNGSIAKVVELMQKRNAVLQDAVFKEGNLETGHKFTSRTGLPSVAWRRFNKGVPSSKSRTDQITETTGMLAGLSEVDSGLAKLNGNGPAFRMSEDKAFIQAFNQEVEESMLYASQKTTPDEITGLAPRYDDTTGQSGSQIISLDAAAAGNDQTSMWFVVWGEDTVFGITPKGIPGGLTHKDMGEELVEDADGNKYPALRTWWEWHLGLCVKDYRYVVRLANIDTSTLAKTGKVLIQGMVESYHQLQDTISGRLAIYCNRHVATYLHLQALDSVTNSTLAIQNIGGQPITTFLGAPIRQTDAITTTEAPVT